MATEEGWKGGIVLFYLGACFKSRLVQSEIPIYFLHPVIRPHVHDTSSSFSVGPQTVEVKRSTDVSSECRKKNIPTKIKKRHVFALFRSNRWKYKCCWPDFYLNGLKPVYQIGFDRRFGYRAQPLRLFARWFFAKAQRENGQSRA